MSNDEVVDLCRDLIRIDTTNTGDTRTSAGERVAAEFVAAQLAEVGLEPVLRESAPGRTSVFARFPGDAATSTSCRPSRPSGRCTRSPVRSPTGTCGGVARST
jgi:acetylornithine deacetylase/succinyl-diaminopimelate desuccinylase-like protein